MQATDYLLPILMVAILIAVIFGFRHYAKVRNQALQELAKRRGWEFQPELELKQWRHWGDFPLFERGRSHRGINQISGQVDGIDFKMLDFRYITGGGKSSQTHHQSVVCLRDKDLKLPSFELRPEHFGHKFITAFGYQDIDFSASPEFSACYLLRGEHENRIRKLFSSKLRRFLESAPGWCIEGFNDTLLVYRHSKSCPPEEAESFIKQAIGIAGQFSA